MKLNKKDLSECRANTVSGDKNAALSLFRHSMILGHKGRACARFMLANSLGADFSADDIAYQQQAWASLGKKSKERVRSSVEQLLKTI